MPQPRSAETHTSTAHKDAAKLLSDLPALPAAVAHPVMALLCGLPGTGKSHLARRLAAKCPLAVLESDAARKSLFPTPTYSPSENARTFRAFHALAMGLLEKGISVLVDATNLLEKNRNVFYRIAERLQAKLICVHTTAPAEVVRWRLDQRSQKVDRADRSDADWQVYQRMEPRLEPLRRKHYTANTTEDISAIIDQVADEANRWMNNSDAKEEPWISK